MLQVDAEKVAKTAMKNAPATMASSFIFTEEASCLFVEMATRLFVDLFPFEFFCFVFVFSAQLKPSWEA